MAIIFNQLTYKVRLNRVKILSKINTVKKAINIFIPKTSQYRFVEKPELVSVFQEDAGKIKYIHNVLEYRQKQITPEEVLAMFRGRKIDGGKLRNEIYYNIKTRLFFKGFLSPENFKK